MRAIVTKYIGATETKPSRVKAWVDDHAMTFSWNSLEESKDSTHDVHLKAATSLAMKLGWLTGPHDHERWELVGGSLPSKMPAAYAFVMVRKAESK